jgi:hypothetical protein
MIFSFSFVLLCSCALCFSYPCFLWVLSLAYPNLLGTKGYPNDRSALQSVGMHADRRHVCHAVAPGAQTLRSPATTCQACEGRPRLVSRTPARVASRHAPRRRRTPCPFHAAPTPTLALGATTLAGHPLFSSLASPQREVARPRLYNVVIITHMLPHLPTLKALSTATRHWSLSVELPLPNLPAPTGASQLLDKPPLELPGLLIAPAEPQFHRSSYSSGRHHPAPPCELAGVVPARIRSQIEPWVSTESFPTSSPADPAVGSPKFQPAAPPLALRTCHMVRSGQPTRLLIPVV